MKTNFVGVDHTNTQGNPYSVETRASEEAVQKVPRNENIVTQSKISGAKDAMTQRKRDDLFKTERK